MTHWQLVALALVLTGGVAPASALTIVGTANPDIGGTASFMRSLPFYRTGTLDIELEVRGGNAVLNDGFFFSNFIEFYDFFDPATGEPQGGNDTIVEDQRLLEELFHSDSGTWKTSFSVQRKIPYQVQGPSDAFPSEIGFTVSEAGAVGSFSVNAPITYILRLSGSSMVPEPANWAMLIGGFGLVGAALRRRRALTPLYDMP
jgi:hypothetical protein